MMLEIIDITERKTHCATIEYETDDAVVATAALQRCIIQGGALGLLPPEKEILEKICLIFDY